MTLFLLISVLFFFSCSSRNEAQKTVSAVNNISVQQAADMLAAQPAPLVIDVRTPAEYDGELGHIAGSRLLPVQEINRWAADLKVAEGQPVMLVCRSGGRSSHAMSVLAERGYTNLYNVVGGMTAWNRENLPVSPREE